LCLGQAIIFTQQDTREYGSFISSAVQKLIQIVFVSCRRLTTDKLNVVLESPQSQYNTSNVSLDRRPHPHDDVAVSQYRPQYTVAPNRLGELHSQSTTPVFTGPIVDMVVGQAPFRFYATGSKDGVVNVYI
jgi:hypothetical protein